MKQILCAILVLSLVFFCTKPAFAVDSGAIKNPQEVAPPPIKSSNHKLDFKKIGPWQKAVSDSEYKEAINETIKENIAASLVFLILIVISIGFCVKFIIPSCRLAKELQTAKEKLEAIKAKSKVSTIEPDEIAREVMTSPKLSHLWSEYKETLHPQKETDKSGHEKIVRWRATALSETFFTEQALVDTPLKTEFYKHLPGILTGLGIIGTFSGLIFGLMDFDVSADPNAIHVALENLIKSVGNAFIVSSIAISLAMFFTWCEKSHVTERYKQVEELSQLIDSLFEAGAGEEYLERLARSSETSATQAQQIKDSLVTDLKQILSNESNLTLEQILDRHSKQFAQTVTETLKNPLEKISAAVVSVGTNQGEAVNKLLTDVLANFSSQLQEIIGKMFGGQMQGISELLAQTTQAMQATVGKFDELADKISVAGTGAAEAMAERLGQAIASMEVRQNSLNGQMGEFVEQIRSLVSKSQTETSQKLTDTLIRLDDQFKRMINEVQEQNGKTTKENGELVSKLSGTMETLIAQSRETSQALQASTKTTSETIASMNSGAETLYRAASDFAKAGKGVAETMKASSAATEKIHLATASIQQMLEDYKRISENFTVMVTDLKSTMETAKREASLTTKLVDSLQDASNQLAQAQKQAEDYLRGISEVLTKAHTEFASSITKTLREGNSKFHEELAEAVGLLSGSIKDLGDTLDGLGGNQK